MTNIDLEGRTAFVTGSGQNIGRGIAIRLAEAGANVVLNGSSNLAACEETAELIRNSGQQVFVAMGDIGKAEDIARIEKVLPVGWAHGDRYTVGQWAGPERYC